MWIVDQYCESVGQASYGSWVVLVIFAAAIISELIPIAGLVQGYDDEDYDVDSDDDEDLQEETRQLLSGIDVVNLQSYYKDLYSRIAKAKGVIHLILQVGRSHLVKDLTHGIDLNRALKDMRRGLGMRAVTKAILRRRRGKRLESKEFLDSFQSTISESSSASTTPPSSTEDREESEKYIE